MINLAFHDEGVAPTPPPETFAHRLWQEGGMGRDLLLHVGRMAAFERAARDLEGYVADYVVGTFFEQGQGAEGSAL